MSTPDPYTYRAANAITNEEPDLTTMTVDQIAHARGVGKRYAYALLRRAQAEKMDVPIPQNQRELILSILHRSGDYIRNTDHLFEAVRETGSKLPPHDVTKTLWSLQKSQYVKFRERAGGSLYGIALTAEGKKAAARITAPKRDEIVVAAVIEDEDVPQEVIDDALAAVRASRDAFAEATASVALDHDPEVETQVVTEVGPAAPPYEVIDKGGSNMEVRFEPAFEPAVPWFRGNLGGWPSIRAVRDRHNKAIKIRAALALLEEAGEDDAVLGLLDKITFTPLEDEVIQLLKFLKEIKE